MRLIIFFIICLFILNLDTKATDYAILISAGKATTDNAFSNSEYWYDLFLAYEDLILKEGYSHDRIFVFYGDGTSFSSTLARYKLALHGWNNIVDFDNSFATMNTEFATLGNIISNNDNLLIRWVVGHGDESGWDNYSAYIQNRNTWITETQIVTMINQINNYKRRKIMWMTCRSGCLVYGNTNLNNNSTVTITSSNWNQDSYAYNLPGETIHAEYNYVITSALFGENPLGTTFNSDTNGDTVINMWELWNEADINQIMHSDPQLGDIGNLANKIYIDEHLVVENTGLNNDIEYIVEDYEFLNSSIQSGSDIEIDIDNSFEINGTFVIPVGSTLNVHQ